ncbi:CapA family protein [Nocardioides mangrovi]|uniref:CapA family protein n=1 Tax=Nocardioides mangrovi TaxID=2874580 RepID=A0ABS7UAP8_9ACTN|nr:CapA family protein [Nocardioides mangrovi]MBZ5738069.1 CapA family protein [Nocardioides mangrovi]
MRSQAGWVVVLAVLAAGCTDYPGGGSRPPSSVGPTSASPSSSAPLPTSPPPWVTEDLDDLTTRPLVFAVNARRPPLDLTTRQADRLQRGAIHRWSQVGQAGGRLRTTDLSPGLRHLPMDTIAIEVADAMTPALRVATVDGVDPLRDPASYAVQVQGPAPAPVTTLTVVGDVMLGRGVSGDPLAPMSERLAAADITVGNLESTLSDDGAPTQGGDSFHASPSVRADLRGAGFDALDLANNHAGDYGDRALEQTVRLLDAGGLRPFGAGADLAEARAPVVVARHGIRFGFLGFNAIGETPEAGPDQPGANAVSMPPRTGPLDRAELDRVLGDVRRLARRVDVVVVLPHWGTQYTHRPEPVQHVVARALVRAGADLVVGGHPHWVQGAEQVGDALVVHSLGNFVFDMDFSPQTMEGLVLEATFWGGRLMAADFVPYRMDDDFAPHVVPVTDAGSVLDPFWAFSSLAAPRR